MATTIEQLRERHKGAVGDKDIHVKASAAGESMKVDWDNRLIKGLASTTLIDEDGEVVVPAGADLSYFLGADPENEAGGIRTVYKNHDYTVELGVCRRMAVRSNGLWAQTYVTKLPIGEDTLTLIDEGIIRGQSIGFAVNESGPPTDEETRKYGPCRIVTRSYKVIEYSITGMPCNPGALLEAVTKGMIHRTSAVVFGLPDTPIRKWFPVKGKAEVEREWKAPKVWKR